VSLSVDAWYTHLENISSSMGIVTPNVFFEELRWLTI